MRRKERTINGRFEVSGVGLHTGENVRLRVHGAPPGTGVQFIRSDIPGAPRVVAHMDNYVDYPRRTSLRRGEAEVQTVEHFLAACQALKIDNLVVNVDGVELPAIDGSSKGYFTSLKSAGVIEQDAEKDVFVIKEPIAFTKDGASLVALPSPDGLLSISYTLDYSQKSIPPQHITLKITEETFERQLAPARTFCLEDEAAELVRLGLGKGASNENTIVASPTGPKNNTLRFPDEYVRHKVTDLLGDLFLAGVDIAGHLVAVRSGHSLNILLVERVLSDRKKMAAGGEETGVFDIRDILRTLPHRYPFVMVDRIVELEPNRRAVGIKNVTYNEHYFQGHFPAQPVMPAVLQIEAMAQVGGLIMLKKRENENKLPFMLAVDKVKLRHVVVPGDTLRIEAEAVRVKNRTGEIKARCLVDGRVVSEALIRFMLVDVS